MNTYGIYENLCLQISSLEMWRKIGSGVFVFQKYGKYESIWVLYFFSHRHYIIPTISVSLSEAIISQRFLARLSSWRKSVVKLSKKYLLNLTGLWRSSLIFWMNAIFKEPSWLLSSLLSGFKKYRKVCEWKMQKRSFCEKRDKKVRFFGILKDLQRCCFL